MGDGLGSNNSAVSANAVLGKSPSAYADLGGASSRADPLHRLVGDWQLLADLSFADLVLFVPDPQGRFTVVAQMRPTTGPTSYQEDLAGPFATPTERPQLAAAAAEGRIVREGDPVWLGGVPVREEVLPVTSNGRVIAVIARGTNLAAA